MTAGNLVGDGAQALLGQPSQEGGGEELVVLAQDELGGHVRPRIQRPRGSCLLNPLITAALPGRWPGGPARARPAMAFVPRPRPADAASSACPGRPDAGGPPRPAPRAPPHPPPPA